MISPPILLQQNRRTDHGNIQCSINRSQIHDCGNWERCLAVSFRVLFVSHFWHIVFAVWSSLCLPCCHFHSFCISLSTLSPLGRLLWGEAAVTTLPEVCQLLLFCVLQSRNLTHYLSFVHCIRNVFSLMVAISIIEGTSLHLKIFKCPIINFHISRKKILQGYNIFSAILQVERDYKEAIIFRVKKHTVLMITVIWYNYI